MPRPQAAPSGPTNAFASAGIPRSRENGAAGRYGPATGRYGPATGLPRGLDQGLLKVAGHLRSLAASADTSRSRRQCQPHAGEWRSDQSFIAETSLRWSRPYRCRSRWRPWPEWPRYLRIPSCANLHRGLDGDESHPIGPRRGIAVCRQCELRIGAPASDESGCKIAGHVRVRCRLVAVPTPEESIHLHASSLHETSGGASSGGPVSNPRTGLQPVALRSGVAGRGWALHRGPHGAPLLHTKDRFASSGPMIAGPSRHRPRVHRPREACWSGPDRRLASRKRKKWCPQKLLSVDRRIALLRLHNIAKNVRLKANKC